MQKLMIITLDLMQHTRNKTNMRYIKSTIDTTLEEQKNSTQRKPLLLRGARQVGKSSTIRELSKKFSHFVEVNFESEKAVRTFFEGNLNPHQICDRLSLYYETPIIPGETLLFLDEYHPSRNKIRDERQYAQPSFIHGRKTPSMYPEEFHVNLI